MSRPSTVEQVLQAGVTRAIAECRAGDPEAARWALVHAGLAAEQLIDTGKR